MTSNYPIITTRDAVEIGEAVESHFSRTGSYAGFDDTHYKAALTKTRQCKEDFEEALLAAFANQFQLTRKSIMTAGGSAATKKNEQEEEFAQLAVRMARELPLEALQDPDFWRYLSVFHFRDYIISVEGDFEPRRYGGLGNRNLVRWTLIRGLVWGLHSTVGDDASGVYLARLKKEELGKGSEVRDLYISHVIRPEWAKVPSAGRAFINAAMAEPPLFDVGNDFRPWQQLNARIRRVSENVYFASLDSSELESLMTKEREGIPTEPAVVIAGS